MNRKLTVILGMHRSGTSLLAAGLSYSGLKFGDELMGGTAFNLKGHWEDNDIVAFNNRVLSELGMTWDSLEFIDDVEWQRASIQVLIAEGERLLTKKLTENDGHFAFKDPRTIRVLPIWLEIFTRLGISPKFVVSFRNPLDVGASLAKRECKPLSLTQLLWMHHNFSYLKELLCSEYQVAFIDFYDFCKRPQDILTQVGAFLSLNPQVEALKAFSEVFYDEALVTKQTDPYQLSENGSIFSFVFESYRYLRLLQKSYTAEEIHLALSATKTWSNVGSYLCNQYLILMQENLNNQQSIRAQEREKQQELASQLERKKMRAVAGEGIEKSLLDIKGAIYENSKQLVELATKKYEVDKELSNITRRLDASMSSIAADKDSLGQSAIISFNKLDDLTAKLQAILESEKNMEHAQQKVLIQQLQAEIVHLQNTLKQAQVFAEDKQQQLVSIQHSLSWRLTSPFRKLLALLLFSK